MSNISDLSDTVIAKSDQLNADDLVGMDKTITVTAVSRGNAENPVVVNYQGDDGRPFKPCKTVRRILIAAWGKDGNEWVGKQAVLYCDPSVKYGGKEVGGIRISALSDIPKPLSVKLSETRGKKKEHRIEILQPEVKPPYPVEKFNEAFDAMTAKIKEGKMTAEQVITKCEMTGQLSDEQRGRIRDIESNLATDVDSLFDEDEQQGE